MDDTERLALEIAAGREREDAIHALAGELTRERAEVRRLRDLLAACEDGFARITRSNGGDGRTIAHAVLATLPRWGHDTQTERAA